MGQHPLRAAEYKILFNWNWNAIILTDIFHPMNVVIFRCADGFVSGVLQYLQALHRGPSQRTDDQGGAAANTAFPEPAQAGARVRQQDHTKRVRRDQPHQGTADTFRAQGRDAPPPRRGRRGSSIANPPH